MTISLDATPCPACGGSGGGPFGRPGSAWDVEDYVCPRCQGLGMLQLAGASTSEAARVAGPGIAKTSQPPAAPEEKSRRATRAS